MTTDSAIRQAVDEFLERVNSHLAEQTPQQKRDILADLEAHIYEALASRAADQQVTLEDLQIVLAQMDQPESYAQSAETPATVPPNRRATGIVALSTSLGTLVLAVSLAIVTAQLSHEWQGYLLEGMLAYLIFLAGQVTSFILGLIAWNSRFGKAAVILSVALVILSLYLFISIQVPVE